MRVKATRLGWDGFKRRYEGDEFEINDSKYVDGDKIPKGKIVGDVKAFSPSWMEVVIEEEIVRPEPKKSKTYRSSKVERIDTEVL